MTTAGLRLAGMDVGGTWTDVVVVDGEGTPLAHSRVATDSRHGEHMLDGMAEAIMGTLDAATVHPSELVALGVGMPGQVDPSTGVVRLAMNLRIDDRGLGVGAGLERRLGIPVTVENDVRSAAVGAFDHLRPTHPDLSSLAYLSIGTGLSAGFVIDGHLHRGRAGMAGEIGHVVVDEGGPPCRCGLRGCLEAVAAGPAITAMWPSADGRPAEDLFRAAESGDRSAVRLAAVLTGHWVRAIQWIAATFGADLVALGGGVGSTGGPLLASIRGRLESISARSDLARRMLPPERVIAMPSDLPVGALGAAGLALQWKEGGVTREVSDGSGIAVPEGRRG